MKNIWLLVCALLLSACQSENTLTESELQRQSAADSIVASVLFDHELDTLTSYNVHADGFVVIKFAQMVSFKEYTDVVNILRNSSEISGVRAEQSGREVCILSGR